MRGFGRSFTKDLPIKNKGDSSLSDPEKAENKQLSRCRIVVEHIFAHLKKWQILVARYRGLLDNYAQIFQTIAGLRNFLMVG